MNLIQITYRIISSIFQSISIRIMQSMFFIAMNFCWFVLENCNALQWCPPTDMFSELDQWLNNINTFDTIFFRYHGIDTQPVIIKAQPIIGITIDLTIQ